MTGPVPGGWRPLRAPRRPTANTPAFARLARTHALAVAGDTFVAVALADSLFFSLPEGRARGQVLLYLLLTMAPFAVVAPLVGPLLDRFRTGRRWVVVGSAAGRALICAAMVRDVDSLLLFPEAFGVLVLTKAYHVAKAAIVPAAVPDRRTLVEANAKLSLLSGVMGFVAAVPAVAASWLGGSEATLVLAAMAYAGAAVVARSVPGGVVEAPGDGSGAGPDGGGAPLPARVALAASAMMLLRAVVGFLTFLLAFSLRGGGTPTWWFGVVLAASVVGSLAGAWVAPPLRRRMREEHLLDGVLGLCAVGALAAAWWGGLTGAALAAGVVGLSASAGKLAFDAIVQRDAPDSDRGRAFARFETRFQIAWVIGALVPVVVTIPDRLGLLVLSGAATFALVSYGTATAAVRRRARAMRSPSRGATDPSEVLDAGQPQAGRLQLGRRGQRLP